MGGRVVSRSLPPTRQPGWLCLATSNRPAPRSGQPCQGWSFSPSQKLLSSTAKARLSPVASWPPTVWRGSSTLPGTFFPTCVSMFPSGATRGDVCGQETWLGFPRGPNPHFAGNSPIAAITQNSLTQPRAAWQLPVKTARLHCMSSPTTL